MNDSPIFTGTSTDIYWRYEEPVNKNDTMFLLTAFGKIVVKGTWSGKLGEYYIAYSPMIKRDKDKERELGFI